MVVQKLVYIIKIFIYVFFKQKRLEANMLTNPKFIKERKEIQKGGGLDQNSQH